MSPEKLAQKLTEAGAVMTSAGPIIIDSQRFVRSFIAALQTIEDMEARDGDAPTMAKTLARET